jgi:inosine-uridine nucleoside N-ribohydrolase
MTVTRHPRQYVALVVATLFIFGACGTTQSDEEIAEPALTTSAAGKASSTTGLISTEPSDVPVVVVGDADWSELMADLYLLSRSDVDVLAIAITGTGMSHCPEGAENIASVVAALGGDVPVACGANDPLEGFNAFPGAWRANADLFGGLELPSGIVSDKTASELITSAILESAYRVHVLSHGPLTDLASAIAADPLIVDNIERITIMGGALDVPGNTMSNPNADWNFWIDPKAARDVIGSGAPITLVPLDATNQAPISVFFLDALAANQHERAAEILHEYVLSDPSVTGPGAYFWDPLTAAVMLEPDLAVFKRVAIRVLDGETDEQGRIREDPAGTDVRVVVSVDGDEFLQHFLRTLNDGAALTATPQQPDSTVVLTDQGCNGEGLNARPAGRVVIELVNSTDDMTWFAMGTYNDGFGRQDMIAHAEEATSLNPPSFVEVVHAVEVPSDGETITAVELEEGIYWSVCLSEPARVDVLDDAVVGS